ncbi:MAG TPA: FecR domain-containing protein [Steroidobacter sp.]|uniref:FecR family protein n=1 Tax=Steroidobacter sp. TaxID=1978227 RepID=UPI002ED7E086
MRMPPTVPPDYAEAAAWLARLRAEHRTRDDEARFRQWLAADPMNAERFEHVATIWDDMDALRDFPRSEPAPRRLISRRKMLAGSLAVFGVGGLGLQWSIATAGVYTTARGEQRRLTLEDGSRLLLNTETSLKVRFDSEQRRIELRRGQALFEVSSDPRPFSVNAGEHDLTVARGRFDMRREEDELSVLAIEGVATLAKADNAAVRISVGERVRVDAELHVEHDRPDLNDMLAWQSGHAAFRGEPLARVVTEMNRYSERELVLMDERASALRISGVYRVGDNSAFARSLARLLPIRVEESDRVIRIRAL